MKYELYFEPQAQADLEAISDWIEAVAGPEVALAYIERIERKCRSLADFPNRGTPRRHDASLRSIPFERRATILYGVDGGLVRIWGVYHSGRQIDPD